MMDLIIKAMCALGIFVLGCNIKNYLLASRRIDEVQNEQIHSHRQIYSLLKGKGMQIKLLMMSCQQSENRVVMSLTTQRKINQYALIKNNFKRMLNMPNKLGWVSNQVSNQVLTVEKVASKDLFSVQHVLIKEKQASRKPWLAYLLNSCYDNLIEVVHKGQILRAFGFLLSTFQLLKNRSLIVECLFEDGKITPKLMGQSKLDIIEHYKDIKTDSIRRMILGVTAIYIFVKLFSKKDRKPAQQGEDERKITYFSADVDRILQCQVCRNNCCNVIMKKCTHLCICRQCLFDRDYINQCPLCGDDEIDKIVSIRKFQE